MKSFTAIAFAALIALSTAQGAFNVSTGTSTITNSTSSQHHHWITPTTYIHSNKTKTSSEKHHNTTMPNPHNPSTYIPTKIVTLTAAPTSSQTPTRNGTSPFTTQTGSSSGTKTPVGPATTGLAPAVFAGGAAANRAGAVIALAGMLAGVYL